MSKHGISTVDLEIIRDILHGIDDICIFGSRIKGSYKRFSDLDICLKKSWSDYDYEILKEKFEKSDLPFTVDLVQYNYITDSFKKIIDQECISLKKFFSFT